jgi:Domain of unknown function (DUF4070)
VEYIYDPGRYFERTLRSFQRLPRAHSFKERRKYFQWMMNAELKRSSSVDGQAKSSLWKTLHFFIKMYRSFPPDFRKPLGHFLRHVIWTCPEQLPRSLSFILMGYHCYLFTSESIVPTIDATLARMETPHDIPKPPQTLRRSPELTQLRSPKLTQLSLSQGYGNDS